MPVTIERSFSDGIAVITAGDANARPLVLLHGIGSNARSFEPLMRALEGRRRTIAWDAPGYGASRPFDADWPTAGDYADALAHLIDRLALPSIDLLGHSLGAVIAAQFAVRHAARLGRLVLASPALGYGTAPGAALAPQAGNRLAAMTSEGARTFAEARGPGLVYDKSNAALVAAVVGAMSEVKLPGYAHASRMLSTADLIADAGSIKAPTLVIVGAHDTITPPANCERAYTALAAASPAAGHAFALVPDAGHALPQEQPVLVARHVLRFLDNA